MADQATKTAPPPEPPPEPTPTVKPTFRLWLSVRAEMAALFRAIDSPWTLALLLAAALNTSLLLTVLVSFFTQGNAPEVMLITHAAPYLAIIAFWFAGRRWGVQSYAPAMLVGLCFLPIYANPLGFNAHGDVLMIPALLIAAHFGAAPQFPKDLYAYRRVGPIDALVIFCLLATGAVIFQALAVDAERTDNFGPIFVAGGGVAPMVVIMLALAISGADRRLALIAILLATAISLPGLALPTAPSMSPFVSQHIGLSLGGALSCLTALYIDKAVPLLLRWRWEAGIKSILSLGAAIYLSQWVILIEHTAHSGRLIVNEFSGWVAKEGGLFMPIGQPSLSWLIAFAIGVAFCLRRTHIALPLHQATFSVRNGGVSENAGYLVILSAILAIYITGDFADLGDWGLLNSFLTFRLEGVLFAQNVLFFGAEWLASSLTFALLTLGYFAARPFARDDMLGPQLAVWRAVRRGAEAPERPERPRRILLAKVMGAGWVWSGPVIFGLALSMMVGGELARREIAFDPRSAIRDHGREEQLTEQQMDDLDEHLSIQIGRGSLIVSHNASDTTIRLNSSDVGPFRISDATQVTLERVATALRRAQIPGPIAVRAFTSNEPPTSIWYRTNDELSAATARRVAGFLASHMRDPSRVSAEGRGDREPIADPNGPTSDLNNRIEIVLLGPPTSDEGPQSLDELVRSFETCGALSVSKQSTRAGRRISGALRSEEDLQQLEAAVSSFGALADFNDIQKLPSETCEVRASLSAEWRRTVEPLCRATVDVRYPFYRSAEAEASLQDFTALFAPVGAMDIFFVINLADLVDQGARPWQWRKDVDLGYSDKMLEQFQSAANLRDAYFAGGELSWAFEIEVAAMDSDLSRSVLDIGGLQISYAQGPVQTVPMEWPLSEGASLRFSPEIAAAENALVRTGAWAWFRLLDAADLQETKSPNVIRATFEIGDRAAIYDVRSASATNPMLSSPSLEFRCPTEL